MDLASTMASDGTDLDVSDFTGRLLFELQARDEAIWAVVCQGRVVAAAESHNFDEDRWTEVAAGFTVYLPDRWYQWWSNDERSIECWRCLLAAARSVIPQVYSNDEVTNRVHVERLLDVPDELVDFVARNTGRPMPRRYNSTVVPYLERDGVAWLTPPEVKLYDALKETGWLFIPQPPMLASDEIDRKPDFLLFWKHRAQFGVLVEVDSDRFHSAPSQREADESKERLFESRGFQYLRFSAKAVLDDPFAVIRQINDYCSRKFGV